MAVQTTQAGLGRTRPVARPETFASASRRIVRGVRAAAVVLVTTGAAGSVGCTGATDESKLPPEVRDPTTLRTPSGAMARYQGALTVFGYMFDHFMTITGVMTDELANVAQPLGTVGTYTGIDSRTDLSGTVIETDYNRLHLVRAEAREARGFLSNYAPGVSPALAGHLYAIEGYADVLLADLFCSGIPLSTLDFDGNYTLQPGSSTADVYRTALALFDSAVAMTSDSAAFQSFAALGRGRTLLALGRSSEAAAAVAMVPDGYAYRVAYKLLPRSRNATGTDDDRRMALYLSNRNGIGGDHATPSIGDHEGVNGLDYRSSNDHRILVQDLGEGLYFPAQYPQTGFDATFTLANGVEARLIEAEALLQANPGDGQWLAKLNALRNDGTFELRQTTNTDDDPSATYQHWHAGAGGVDSLPPLDDPVDPNARVDVLFRERAFWLYLTGHRQGDLRRLVRNYQRNPSTVYPSGNYSGGNGSYGDKIVAPVPASEALLNPQYGGCLGLGA